MNPLHEQPDTEEMPRAAAALIVTHENRPVPQGWEGTLGGKTAPVVTATRLQVVHAVDFYRDDLFR